MAGTVSGGKAAAKKNLENDPDFYRKIAKKAQESYKKKQALGIAKPRGFAANRELARSAGAKGGTISRRNKNADNK